MRELGLNFLALLSVAMPQILIRIINHYFWWNSRKKKSRWTDAQVETTMFVVFLISLVVLNIFVLPYLGLRPNPRFDPR